MGLKVLNQFFRGGHVLEIEALQLIHGRPSVLSQRIGIYLPLGASEPCLDGIVPEGIGRQLSILIHQISFYQNVIEQAPGGVDGRRAIWVFRHPHEIIPVWFLGFERIPVALIDHHSKLHSDTGALASLAAAHVELQMNRIGHHLNILVLQTK